MAYLALLLIERVGLIILLAYLLVRISVFRQAILAPQKKKSIIILLFVFISFVLLSNATGVEITETRSILTLSRFKLGPQSVLANTRVLTIGMAGAIGGPAVGIPVGIVSAAFRYTQGGAHVLTYVWSSLIISCVSSWYHVRYIERLKNVNIRNIALLGASMEIVQMILIYLFSHQKEQALYFIQLISVPMIFANTLGSTVFMSIIQSTIREVEMTRVEQTRHVFRLATQLLRQLSHGLTDESVESTVTSLYEVLQPEFIVLRKQDHLLAQRPNCLSNECLQDIQNIQLKREEVAVFPCLGCVRNQSTNQLILTLPLCAREQILGEILMGFQSDQEDEELLLEIATGLSEMLSLQLTLYDANEQVTLLKDAEIKALQAQINPHFFFNTVNTIAALTRVDAKQAREMLLELSHYFRANITGANQSKIMLQDELKHVRAYLKIEHARFPERYVIEREIDETLLHYLIPPFTIQMLVENAVKHAVNEHEKIQLIRIQVTGDEAYLQIAVTDNGKGIPAHIMKAIESNAYDPNSPTGTGTGLKNVKQRLHVLYGDQLTFKIKTTSNGTTIYFKIPKELKREE
ncbi:LytS/YhcK type 5TM receptor domain-containing protein [Atopobacter phocae]|uniref:LytS/YhcK type 5TM receptor domain-containing protein n=1 Tax=Atopobacter phocae TaxID=136492 RepID=UPI000471D50E|nr:LytS/YhcK type 5TM receptor domain-containing protein [Atopobacter phocae]